MTETQKTIGAWSSDTFGDPRSNARVAARANEEMSELLRVLTADDGDTRAVGEAADVLIVLYRLAERLGLDLLTEVDRKMGINRGRVWDLDDTGHGYHVRRSDAERARHEERLRIVKFVQGWSDTTAFYLLGEAIRDGKAGS